MKDKSNKKYYECRKALVIGSYGVKFSKKHLADWFSRVLSLWIIGSLRPEDPPRGATNQ